MNYFKCLAENGLMSCRAFANDNFSDLSCRYCLTLLFLHIIFCCCSIIKMTLRKILLLWQKIKIPLCFLSAYSVGSIWQSFKNNIFLKRHRFRLLKFFLKKDLKSLIFIVELRYTYTQNFFTEIFVDLFQSAFCCFSERQL